MNELRHRRVIVTRAAAQARALLSALQGLGAEAICLPTVRIGPPAHPALVALARQSAPAYDGFLFASANAVRAFFAATTAAAPTRKPGSWIAAVGPATAAALPPGWRADIIPETYSGAALLESLSARPLRGQRILIPRGNLASDTLPAELAGHGATVLALEVYQTMIETASQGAARALFPAAASAAPPTAVLLASPSAARHLAALLGVDYRDRLAAATLAAIGPATAAAVVALGLSAPLRAAIATDDGMAQCLVEHWHA